MDNNNPAQIPPIPAQPMTSAIPVNPVPNAMPNPIPPQPMGMPAASNPQTPQQTSQPPPQPKAPGSSKLILWLVIGLILIVLLAGGAYLYMVRQQTNSVVQNPVPVTTPVPTPQENLENSLNGIDIATDSGDFTSIDQDLNQL